MPKPAAAPKAPTKPSNRSPWFEIKNLGEAKPDTAEIRFRGIIGEPTEYRDWWTGELIQNSEGAGTFAEFEAQLDALGNIGNIEVCITSPGGDYFAGLAIHDRLCRHPANKVCIIDGQCDSAATYIALACNEIQIPANASMTIHRASGGAWGNADEMRSYITMLEEIDTNIADIYSNRCGRTVDEMLEMMSLETRLNGKQAVELGLADTVLNNTPKKATLPTVDNRVMNFKAPAAALALFDNSDPANANTAPAPTPTMSLRNRSPLMTSAEKGGSASAGNPGNKTGNNTSSPKVTNEGEETEEEKKKREEAEAADKKKKEEEDAAAENLKKALGGVDLVNLIGAAVNNAVDSKLKPVLDEQARISNLAGHGITPKNLAGAEPTNVGAPGAAAKTNEHPLNKVTAAWPAAKSKN